MYIKKAPDFSEALKLKTNYEKEKQQLFFSDI